MVTTKNNSKVGYMVVLVNEPAPFRL